MVDFSNPVGEIDARCALEIFERQHPEIARDPARIVKANQLLEVACNYVPFEELSPEQMAAALEQTAKATRAWFGLKEHKERKAAVATPRQETYSDIIAEMRRGRGQAA